MAVLFRSSTLSSAPSVVLKDVVIHLVLPSGQKLPEASLVSLDRFLCILLPIDGCQWEFSPPSWFPGGPSKWLRPLLAAVWLRTLLSLPPLFFRVPSGPVALFSVRPWGDGLSFQLDFPSQAFRRRCLGTLHPVLSCLGCRRFGR
jgi:hypothetical protein